MERTWRPGWPCPVTTVLRQQRRGAGDPTSRFAPDGVAAGVRQNIGSISGLESPMIGEAPITPEFAQEVIDGLWYVNIHTAMHAPGEIRG